MKTLLRSTLITLLGITAVFGSARFVLSHCEIPCGIYGDKTRVEILSEHITTIEKSMNQIMELQKKEPVNYNQLVRWVNNKEEHATKIQHIVTQYFMTQRVKPSKKNYVDQLTSLHGMLVYAMKTKQTTDVANCKGLRDSLHKFAKAYFSEEDLKHIQGEHKEHK